MKNRHYTGDILLDICDFVRVVKLIDRVLKTEIKKLAFKLLQLCTKFFGSHFSDFFRLHSLYLPGLFFCAAFYKLTLDRKFVSCETHSFFCYFFRYAAHFEKDSARLYDCDPVFGRAFTGTHSGLCGLFCDRLIREDLYPYLTATLDVSCHRDTGGFDLVACYPCRLKRDKTVFTVCDLVAAKCLTFKSAALYTTVLNSLRH